MGEKTGLIFCSNKIWILLLEFIPMTSELFLLNVHAALNVTRNHKSANREIADEKFVSFEDNLS